MHIQIHFVIIHTTIIIINTIHTIILRNKSYKILITNVIHILLCIYILVYLHFSHKHMLSISPFGVVHSKPVCCLNLNDLQNMFCVPVKK